MKHLITILMLLVIIFSAAALSQVPQKFSYQGLLKTTSCTFVADGNYDIQFDFYDALTMGILKHTETKNGVPVSKGTFNVVLGPMPLIFVEAIFVEIKVLAGPDISVPQTFSPRYELTTAPYAFNAIHAMTANPVGPAGGDLTGTYPDPNIAPDAVTTGKILDGTILGGDIANSQIVRSLNNITDHVKLVGKDGAAITSNLDTIFIHAGGGGGGGISAIQNTDGRLAITNPTGPTATINISKTGASAGQALIYDGANVVWQTPGGGGGLTLPYAGSAATDGNAFSITNTGAGKGIYGESPTYGIEGRATNATGIADGVRGVSNSTGGTGVFGWATTLTGQTYGIFGTVNSPSGYGVFGYAPKYGIEGRATNTTGIADGVRGVSLSTGGTGVFGWANATSGVNYGVYGTSNSSSGNGVYGHASATSGLTSGVYGLSNSTSGSGVFGDATSAIGAVVGVYGRSYSYSGSGVYGRGEHSSGNNHGVYGMTISTSGIGVRGYASASSGANYGVYGESNSPSGRGVQGVSPYLGTYGRADATSGVNYGVYGKSMSTSGYGVYGTAEATTGINYGVYGKSNSINGRAMYGIAEATSGTNYGVYGRSNSPSGVGVRGHSQYRGVSGYGASRSTAGSSIGVYGDAFEPDGPNPGTYYAGYFVGEVHVQGTLSKSSGAFKIDHPLDPENKYLYHSFVESPDMMNIYNGNIILNDKGEAVVQLPEWFGALNKEFRYQLTCIGGYANVYISEKVSKNQFKIAGGTNGLEVSWQVTGIRKDAFAEKNRIPIEEDKKSEERGRYLHPEAFGKSREQGVDVLHSPKLPDETMQRDEMHSLTEPNIPDVLHEPPHEPKHIEDLDRLPQPEIPNINPPVPPDPNLDLE